MSGYREPAPGGEPFRDPRAVRRCCCSERWGKCYAHDWKRLAWCAFGMVFCAVYAWLALFGKGPLPWYGRAVIGCEAGGFAIAFAWLHVRQWQGSFRVEIVPPADGNEEWQ